MSTALADIPELQYADLVAAARARIPALCPAWTDHGPADLGITLLELLASISEMLRYRTRRETAAMTRAFLELLAGSEVAGRPDLAAATREALAQIWTPYRAVTPDDYEALARDVWPASPESAGLAAPRLHRAVALPERDLEAGDPLAPAPGHLSLVVLPDAALPDPSAVLAPLWRFFEPRRLITTRHHVVLPRPLPVRVQASVYLDDDVLPATVAERVRAALAARFDPRSGGPDGAGWPLGGDVYVSDLYALLDAVDGVDFVAAVAATTSAQGRGLRDAQNDPVGLRVHPHESVAVALAAGDLRLYEPVGDGWKEVSA